MADEIIKFGAEVEAPNAKRTEADLLRIERALQRIATATEATLALQTSSRQRTATREVERQTKAVRQQARSYEGLRRSAALAGSAITAGVTAAGTGLGALLTATIAVGAGFEDTFVQSTRFIFDADDELQQRMRQQAVLMSREVPRSARELATAYEFLSQAGFKAEAAVGALPVVARFAQAGQLDLKQATDLLTDSLFAFQLQSDNVEENNRQLERMADLLVQVSRISNTSVRQIAQALTNRAAAQARVFGTDPEETLAVLAAFAQQGIKGKISGQQTFQAIRDLGRAAVENAQEFRSLGVEVFDKATGGLRNFADILSDIEGNFDRLTPRLRQIVLNLLGIQQRSQIATLTLVGLSDTIRDYEFVLRNAGGVTELVADKSVGSLLQQVRLLANDLQGQLIPAYQTLDPVLKLQIANAREWVAANEEAVQSRLTDFLETTIRVGRDGAETLFSLANAVERVIRAADGIPVEVRNAGLVALLLAGTRGKLGLAVKALIALEAASAVIERTPSAESLSPTGEIVTQGFPGRLFDGISAAISDGWDEVKSDLRLLVASFEQQRANVNADRLLSQGASFTEAVAEASRIAAELGGSGVTPRISAAALSVADRDRLLALGLPVTEVATGRAVDTRASRAAQAEAALIRRRFTELQGSLPESLDTFEEFEGAIRSLGGATKVLAEESENASASLDATEAGMQAVLAAANAPTPADQLHEFADSLRALALINPDQFGALDVQTTLLRRFSDELFNVDERLQDAATPAEQLKREVAELTAVARDTAAAGDTRLQSNLPRLLEALADETFDVSDRLDEAARAVETPVERIARRIADLRKAAEDAATITGDTRLRDALPQLESIIREEELGPLRDRAEALRDLIEPQRVLLRQLEEVEQLARTRNAQGDLFLSEEEAQRIKQLLREDFVADADEGFERLLDATERFGSRFENTLAEALARGELDFDNFVRAVLADINRLAINQFITRPVFGAGGLIQSVFSSIGGTTAAQTASIPNTTTPSLTFRTPSSPTFRAETPPPDSRPSTTRSTGGDGPVVINQTVNLQSLDPSRAGDVVAQIAPEMLKRVESNFRRGGALARAARLRG